MSQPTGPSAHRAVVRLIRNEPGMFFVAIVLWGLFVIGPTLSALVLREIFDHIGGTGGALTPGRLLLLLAAVEAGRWLFLFIANVQYVTTWETWLATARVNLLRSLALDPLPAGPRLPGAPGEAVSRFRDDPADLAEVTDTWVDIATVAIAMTLNISVLLFVDAGLTFLVALPVVAVLIFGSRLAVRLRALRRASREATASVTAFLGDIFGAVSAVKVFGAERAVGARLQELGRHREDTAVRDVAASWSFSALSGVTAEIGIAIVLLVAGSRLRDGSLSLGDLALFASSATALAELARWHGRLVARSRQAEIALERMAVLHATGSADAVVAPVDTFLRTGPGALGTVSRDERDRLDQLSIGNVTVRHAGTGRGVSDISLSLDRGSFTVVTGAVGSGKTTLLRAVLGLVPLDDGVVLWNGRAIADLGTFMAPPRSAYLPQVPRLFSEPLADTVLLGYAEEGGDASEALVTAVRLACLDEDIAAMPHGLQTKVGPRGVRLSGGQAQRTGAARALVRRPELLVVDDVSSALDVETEARLWDGLIEAFPGTTWLVVSHRPRVLERADQVVTLRDGGVT